MLKNGYNIEGAVWHIQELLDLSAFLRKELKYNDQIFMRHVNDFMITKRLLRWLQSWRQDHKRP